MRFFATLSSHYDNCGRARDFGAKKKIIEFQIDFAGKPGIEPSDVCTV